MATPDLQSRTGRIKVSQMHSITMSHTSRIKSCPVIVYRTLSIYNFITAITIYISYPKIVITLSGVISAPGIITVKYPTVLQIFTIPVISGQYRTRIITATHHHTRMYSVQIGNASQKTITTIGTPVSPIHQIATFGHIINCLHRFSGQSIKNGQIFRSGQNTSPLVPIIRICISDHFSCAIHSSITCFHHYFRTTVTIQIKYHELSIMCACTYITSQINTPQLLSIQLVTVENHRTGITIMGIIMCIGRVPFQNNLILTISIHIPNAGIIRSISICLSRQSSPSFGTYQRNIQIPYRSISRQLIIAFCFTFYSFYCIKCGGCPLIRVLKESGVFQRMFIHLFTIPIYIK